MLFRSEPADVGLGFIVTFTLDGSSMSCEWDPAAPWGKKQRKVLPAYRAARDAFLNDVAKKLNTSIAVVEL